ncbi:MAG: cupredoxin family copper-binding protein [Gemmatimonadales bacterium]|nr:cupredoxin family copper-binding protein [Gemmatimonadales bacterium]
MLERPPNLSGGWLGAPGTLQFNFLHRFGVSDAPLRKVTNSPTFVLSYPLGSFLSLGTTYATSSDVAPAFPNEWEAFARLAGTTGPLDLAAQLGYNQAAQSVDGELTLGAEAGRLRLLAVGRVLSNGYNDDELRIVAGGGAVLRLTQSIALAGDVATLFDREVGEEVAWGAALQLAIPYSPHTLSLQVTNTNTATLQGLSRGIDQVRGGFEFTIPITLARYAGQRRSTAGNGVVSADTANVTPAEIRAMAFGPNRIAVSAGNTIAWTNHDQVLHTVTADDGSWDSGPIEPGATWRRTFERAGDYSYHCTPHPFMKGVVVVR